MSNNLVLLLPLLVVCQDVCIAQQLLESQKDPKAPNTIFILTDDQRFDALGHAGTDLISTSGSRLLPKLSQERLF